jgi:hypothetical protein
MDETIVEAREHL